MMLVIRVGGEVVATSWYGSGSTKIKQLPWALLPSSIATVVKIHTKNSKFSHAFQMASVA
jgi:hypothetical protein